MKPFKVITSFTTPLNKTNVDTDQIIPKQFLKLITKSGFGDFLFYDWRYENGSPIQNFVLNDPKYKDSKVLVSGENFGCGSSREHAVWSLLDYGFNVVLAPSFADIFQSNCIKNGLVPISLPDDTIHWLLETTRQVKVDLENQMIRADDKDISFEFNSFQKNVLLRGLDDISQTLNYEKEIAQFEKNSKTPSIVRSV